MKWFYPHYPEKPLLLSWSTCSGLFSTHSYACLDHQYFLQKKYVIYPVLSLAISDTHPTEQFVSIFKI